MSFLCKVSGLSLIDIVRSSVSQLRVENPGEKDRASDQGATVVRRSGHFQEAVWKTEDTLERLVSWLPWERLAPPPASHPLTRPWDSRLKWLGRRTPGLKPLPSCPDSRLAEDDGWIVL